MTGSPPSSTTLPAPRCAAAWAGATAAYLALAAILTWNVWTSPPGAILGGFEGPDLIGSAWTAWWTASALLHGQSPASCDLVYFPAGFYPVAQFNLVDALVTAPFVALAGPVVGYNLGVALMLAATGLAAHAAARWEGAGHADAFFAGSALMGTGFVGVEIWTGRTGQAFLAPLVLALGLWMRVLRGEGGRRVALLAGLATGATLLSYWYYGLFVAFAVAAAAPAFARTARAWGANAAAAGAAAAGIALPFVILLLGGGSTLPGMEGSGSWIDHGPLGRGEPGLNWAMESSLWPLWPLWPGSGLALDQSLARTLLVASAVPLLVVRKGRLAWVLVAAAGWALALGPYVQGSDGDVASNRGLPYLWLYDHLPLFDRFWWPSRAAALVLVAAVLLAARNLGELRADLGRWGLLLPLGAAAVNLGESVARSDHLPLGATATTGLSAAYEAVDGAIINLPVFGEDDRGRLAIWYQTLHHRPILYGLGGHIRGHRPPAIDALVSENPLLRALEAYEHEPPRSVEVAPADVRALVDRGFGSVVLDRTQYTPQRRDLVEAMHVPVLDAILGPPRADDGRTRVWALVPPAATVRLDPAPGWVEP